MYVPYILAKTKIGWPVSLCRLGRTLDFGYYRWLSLKKRREKPLLHFALAVISRHHGQIPEEQPEGEQIYFVQSLSGICSHWLDPGCLGRMTTAIGTCSKKDFHLAVNTKHWTDRKCPRTRYLRGLPFSDLLPPEVSRTSQNSIISWGAGLQHMNLGGTFHIQTKTHFNQLILISVGRTKYINYIRLDCSLVGKKIYALLISMIRFSKMTRKFF